MHLKTLTLRGFKSFASATTLSFEPGVTCVVGPNGSGKSNVVDALAWVMGEQGAGSLRGGTMADVIFAGTSGRPPLGRAEVALTIDNGDGALPIDYTEVTISRTLFRTGGSDYAINGQACRLLDIQELLSDSGLGREMHVIVGQGRLDAVLRATPEERRGFVEEAAGVLKHRRRKEKAVRKLDAMQANLARLQDLTAELRRQLGPLGRQAEVARRAAVVQADLRDARARLLADDLAQLTATLEQELADETALVARRTQVEAQLDAARTRLVALERAAAEAAPALGEATETFHRLSSLRERLRGTASLAADRVRLLGTDEPARGAGQDPDDLDAQADRARRAEGAAAQEVEGARAALAAAVAARDAAEGAADVAERELAAALRAAADRREGVARLAGQVAARRSRVEATEAEIGRLRAAHEEAERRHAAATARFAALEAEAVGAEAGEEDLDAEHEAALEALEAARERVEHLRATAADADRDRAALVARAETLELSLTRKDGAGALLGAEDLPGRLGSVAALLGVAPDDEEAVVAALGPLADAVAVESVDAAVDALRWLRDQDAGRAVLLVGGGRSGGQGEGRADVDVRAVAGLEEDVVAALDLVRAPEAVRDAVAAALAGVVVVDDLARARALVAAHPGLVVATRAGDLVGRHRAAGGSAGAPSALHLQQALDAARTGAAAAAAAAERARFALVGATAERDAAAARHAAALDRLHESDAALAAVAEQLGQLGQTARAARAEAERLGGSLEAATRQLAEHGAELADLAARLAAAEEAPEVGERVLVEGAARRDALARAATEARAAETEARLALRTGEERARSVAGRAAALERAAATERQARARAAERERARRRQAALASSVADGARRALAALEVSLERAGAERAAAEADRADREAALVEVRAQVDATARELAELTDEAHRDEVARAQQRLRVETLRQRAVDELGTDPDVLLEEYGPDRPVPVVPAPGEEADPGAPTTVPYVRDEQERRLRAAERALARLGRVNPLALEEFAALEERHGFLVEQLADLRRTRADLLQIVKDVDERVERVFAEAFADTAAQFDRVFPRLFPGGEGRLVLTDPDDMLTTGIEVEARPAGKKVKRLSLLSGGERSLTAVALLVAIFKARPSPFYVMDEVEAALDDVNLGRLLDVFRELREDSQLIVVTHQKRTMEIADALYGVTMRGDGVTTVISQRLREPAATG
ncbi:chromosome segregation protein SMC [Cellulomonas marina]|uniref:Chromosome partition protein Smc n=1 Tax=Cellulomonas marina TaxID=988821 RepID=A0A1I0VDJ6_9CELL|nr:chromosome segregation protein SMC [Cellulomonas marina]GIG28028.1 chromosome partition protein Smc [Cellulomonas marina]SFA74401.1 condensin subunit Smc [Cellulomonas marina]